MSNIGRKYIPKFRQAFSQVDPSGTIPASKRQATRLLMEFPWDTDPNLQVFPGAWDQQKKLDPSWYFNIETNVDICWHLVFWGLRYLRFWAPRMRLDAAPQLRSSMTLCHIQCLGAQPDGVSIECQMHHIIPSWSSYISSSQLIHVLHMMIFAVNIWCNSSQMVGHKNCGNHPCSKPFCSIQSCRVIQK